MYNNNVPYSISPIPGSGINIPTPDRNSLERRQTCLWISKPAGSTLPNPVGSRAYNWHLKNWLTEYKAFDETSVPKAGDSRLNLVLIAGNPNIMINNQIVIRSVQFVNYCVRSATSGIDTAIVNSLNYSNFAIPQARFEHSPVADWLGNGFRPKILIGGKDIYQGLSNYIDDADSMIGLTIPMLDFPNAVDPMFTGNIEVNAGCFLPVTTTPQAFSGEAIDRRNAEYLFQQQPIICKIEFYY